MKLSSAVTMVCCLVWLAAGCTTPIGMTSSPQSMQATPGAVSVEVGKTSDVAIVDPVLQQRGGDGDQERLGGATGTLRAPDLSGVAGWSAAWAPAPTSNWTVAATTAIYPLPGCPDGSTRISVSVSGSNP
jgi:hypothetical protein